MAVSKILKYENRKSDPEYWDASTPTKEAAALKALFLLLKNDWRVYEDLEADPQPLKGVCKACAADLHLHCQRFDCSCGQRGCPSAADARDRARFVHQRALYLAAVGGDAKAMRELLVARRDDEYEEWGFITVTDPEEAE